jgi:hypothetical protein
VNQGSVSTMWGIMGINGVKNGVVFECVLIVNLFIVMCFIIYVKFLNGVHKSAFTGCVNYFYDFIDRPNGVFIFQ